MLEIFSLTYHGRRGYIKRPNLLRQSPFKNFCSTLGPGPPLVRSRSLLGLLYGTLNSGNNAQIRFDSYLKCPAINPLFNFELKRITVASLLNALALQARHSLLKCIVDFSSFLPMIQPSRTFGTFGILTLFADAITSTSTSNLQTNVITQSMLSCFCFHPRTACLALKLRSDFSLKAHIVLVTFCGILSTGLTTAALPVVAFFTF